MIADRTSSALDSRVMTWRSAAGGRQAGGDWCDVIRISDRVMGLTIGDVAGHGLAVSGAMEAIRSCVVRAMADVPVPSAVLAGVNDVACSYDGGTMVTVIVAFIDEVERTLTFANAGHPPPLMFTPRAHHFMLAKTSHIPLGVFGTYDYRSADSVRELPEEGLLVFYTDGLTEHDRDPVAGEIELVAAVERVYPQPAINAARGIARRVFKRTRGDDDCAVMCVRVAGNDL